MQKHNFQRPEAYDINRGFNFLISEMRLENDADLARALRVSRRDICIARRSGRSISAMMLLRMHDGSGIDIAVLQRIMGERRAHRRNGTRTLRGQAATDDAILTRRDVREFLASQEPCGSAPSTEEVRGQLGWPSVACSGLADETVSMATGGQE